MRPWGPQVSPRHLGKRTRSTPLPAPGPHTPGGDGTAPLVAIEFYMPKTRATRLHEHAIRLGVTTRQLSAEIIDVWLSQQEKL